MEPLIDALYGIPILGIVAQLVGYVVAVLPAIAPIVWGLATPIALGALCGVMNERSGIVNIGIEGMMLTAAFVGFVVGAAAVAFIPADPGFLGITPALVLAVLGAVVAAMLLSALHAWLSITVRADQIISGTIINIMAIGLTGYLNRLVSQTSPQAAGSFRPFSPPAWLVDIPLVGWVLKMILAQGPIGMSVIVLAIGLQIWLFYSRWGLRTRAVGEHPKAAETVGIDVIRLRYRNVIIGGIFAGLAGAYLSLEATGSFQAGMTNGRGFIALAALIFGRWTPLGALGAALLFTASEALGTAIRFQAPPGQLGDILTAIPSQFFSALPYVVTVVVLAGVVGRSIPPAAVGRPYEKEAPA
jgi:ABC-type uncharacterized transport system permease subunit